MKKKFILKKVVYTISLSAIAIIVSLIEIPIPLGQGFKLDFSEVVILVAYLVLGFSGTSNVILIRSLTRRLFRGFDPMGIFGEFLALFGSYIVLITYIGLKRLFKDRQKPLLYNVPIEREKTSLVKWIVIPTVLSLTLGAAFTVAHITVTPYMIGIITTGKPLIPYNGFSNYIWQAFIFAGSYIPLNFIKGAVTGVVFLLIKPSIQQIEL